MDISREIEVRKVWMRALHIYLGLFLLGYTIAVFNTCALNISWTLDWGSNELAYFNLFSTIIPAGISIGCLITGPSISRFGRRKTYIAAGWLYILGTAILLCPFTVMFGIGRMLTGISSGIYGVLPPIYANEITPEAIIGKVGAYIAIMSSSGVVFAYVFGLPLPVSPGSDFNYWWMFMFLFPAAVAGYMLISTLWLVKYDSPQYYTEKGMLDMAEKALRESYTKEGMESGRIRIKADQANATSGEKKANVINIFCDRKFVKMIRIGFIRVFFFQFSGIFTMLFYSTSVFGKLGGGIFISRVLTVIVGLILLIANFLFIPVAKYFGRKTIFVGGDLLMAALMVGAGVTSSHNVGVVWPVVLILLFVLVFGSTANSVTWMYLAEILNPQILVVVSMYSWILTIIITLLFPILADIWDISVLLYIFAVINALGALYSMFDMVETKGKLKADVLRSLNVGEDVGKDKIDDSPTARGMLENENNEEPDEYIEESPESNSADEDQV